MGGLDVRVHRNHFGRQKESFVTDLDLKFLAESLTPDKRSPFPAVFIRAPVVDKLLTTEVEDKSAENQDVVDGEASTAESVLPKSNKPVVEVLAVLPGRHASNKAALEGGNASAQPKGDGDIVALRQGNVFGTSFHPELTDDVRIHAWWLKQVLHDTTPNSSNHDGS